MQNTRLYTKLVVLVLLVEILTIAPVLSSLTDTITIGNEGTISHIEGVAAKSGYWRDIQDAVDQVASAGGGIVYIPAGTWNFVNVNERITTVNIPAGVNVNGSYSVNGDSVTWNTVLRIPWAAGGDPYGTWTGTVTPEPVCFKIQGNSDPNKPSRFNGIKMVGYRSIDANDHLAIKPLTVSSVIDYRVSYCYFEHMTEGFSAVGKYCRGVVDHCWFINHHARVTSPIETCDVGYGCSYFRSFSEDLWDPITEVMGKYTMYTHFVEDCYFSKWRHCIAANDGAHYVVRYSTIYDSFGFGEIDAHGTYNVVGTRAIEVYNNNFLNDIATMTRCVSFHRGGAGVYFNNYATPYDGTKGYSTLVQLAAEGSVAKCWPNDVYVWGNTGTTSISNTDSSKIVQNVNYFLSAMPNYTPYPYPHYLTIETQ